jgi:hypothetical protein
MKPVSLEQAGITARVYFMSMMFNLNMRESGGRIMQDSNDSRPSTGRPSSSFQRSNNSMPKSGPYRHAIISVSQSTTVDVDEVCAAFSLLDVRHADDSILPTAPRRLRKDGRSQEDTVATCRLPLGITPASHACSGKQSFDSITAFRRCIGYNS